MHERFIKNVEICMRYSALNTTGVHCQEWAAGLGPLEVTCLLPEVACLLPRPIKARGHLAEKESVSVPSRRPGGLRPRASPPLSLSL